jgi:hypothetical protein
VEDAEVETPVRDLQEERSRLLSFKQHPGYADLMAIAESQLEVRKQTVFLNPLKSLDETFEQEYMKGEISGIALFSQMIDRQIEALTDEIDEALKEEEDERRIASASA